MADRSITDIIAEQLDKSRQHLEALDSTQKARENVRFSSRRRRTISKLFTEVPDFIELIENFVKSERQKANVRPGQITIVANYTPTRMEVVVPAPNNESPAYQSLLGVLAEYDAKESKAGQYLSISVKRPTGRRTGRTIEEQIKKALSKTYGGLRVDFSSLYDVDFESIRKAEGRGKRASIGTARQSIDQNIVFGTDFYEKNLTPKEIEWGILRFPRKARSFFPGYGIEFRISISSMDYAVHVSSKDSNVLPTNPKAGNYVSSMTKLYQDTDLREGKKAKEGINARIRVEKVAELGYTATITKS